MKPSRALGRDPGTRWSPPPASSPLRTARAERGPTRPAEAGHAVPRRRPWPHAPVHRSPAAGSHVVEPDLKDGDVAVRHLKQGSCALAAWAGPRGALLRGVGAQHIALGFGLLE